MEYSALLLDNYVEISKYIDTGSTWKCWILVCRDFAAMNNINQIRRFSNHLATLLKLFPNKPWDWSEVSRNPNITYAIVQANLDNSWDWEMLSRNPNITPVIVQANLDKPWNWNALSYNK